MASYLPARGEFPVYRVTVDEILDRSLARLLVSPVVAGVEDISDDRTEDWRNERELLVTPDDILDKLGLGRRTALVRSVLGKKALDEPPGYALWRSLVEGQVYLCGRFHVTGRRSAPDSIKVRKGRWDLLRIDRLEKVKRRSKDLYANALLAGTKEDSHG